MFRKSLVGCALFACASMLSTTAFADDAADQEAAARDQARQAVQVEQVEQAEQVETAPAPVQKTTDNWQPVVATDYAYESAGDKTSRIFSEIGSAIMGTAMTVGGGVIIAYAADREVFSDQYGRENRTKDPLVIALIASAIAVPFVEAGMVHWAGDALHSWGLNWTPYAGGAAGGAIGAALGAIGFTESRKTGAITTFACSAVGALIGAITWYEISNNQERAAEITAISNLHPTFEVSDQYTAFGVGFDF